jgi:hypothetical protein
VIPLDIRYRPISPISIDRLIGSSTGTDETFLSHRSILQLRTNIKTQTKCHNYTGIIFKHEIGQMGAIKQSCMEPLTFPRSWLPLPR